MRTSRRSCWLQTWVPIGISTLTCAVLHRDSTWKLCCDSCTAGAHAAEVFRGSATIDGGAAYCTLCLHCARLRVAKWKLCAKQTSLLAL